MATDHREAALALIRELASQGHAVRYIARALDIAGIPTPSGKPGATWSTTAVGRLVRAERSGTGS